ncbi:tetratricopeptide repeat protein [Neptunicoccus sediminis]|uniref:tetratricopeptide repeat protein n=1 Tax=Neptunicoccus sediminis TaxID=1892596 RepID=UPI0009F25842|nr:tetratricopeptide repeat protein [Neptunicoccus sediminis]
MLRYMRVCLAFITVVTLVACQSPEEKAESFYQSGLSLMEAGDLDRAAIEFLNVFQHNNLHKDARRKLADIRLEQGNLGAAYGQYLRLIEQYPDTPEVRLILARVALDTNNWDEARRHGEAAIALVPEDPEAQALAAAFQYRDAKDAKARARAAGLASDLLTADASDEVSRRVVIDHLLRSDTPYDAMAEIDRALERDPESYPYHTLRLRLLNQIQDTSGVGQQLKRMVALYPDDQDLSRTLIHWYLAQGNLTEAEDYLRQLAGDITANPAGHISVVQLIQSSQGPEAAQAELNRLAKANADNANADIYRTLSAMITFDNGNRDSAISIIEDIAANAEPSEQTWRIRNILARLLIATDNRVGARAQVETILSEDSSNVDALKLRAAWAIDDDRAAEAIVDLRTALGQEPRDAEILTLMAQAHEREGALALAGERLALAVDVSGAGPEESLRYAAFLLRNGRTPAARSILTDARNANPGNVSVLTELAKLLLAEGALVPAQDLANDLRSLNDPAAQQAAISLQTALLLSQNRSQDGIVFLQEQIAQGKADTTAIAQVVQIHWLSGNIDAARTYLEEALSNDPRNATLRMLSATLHAISGEFAAAEAGFRDLIEEYPQSEEPVLRLYNLLISTDRAEEAGTVIDAALAVQPRSLNLRWVRADELEKSGNIDGAIALYEEIYAANTDAVTIANNLASLIATHKDDTNSLERAATIAKRLRDSDLPPFQDTYGWIAFRLGNFEEARSYLEPAALGLPDDPLVQFHLGMTYAALEDVDQARRVLSRAIDLAGDSALPQFDTARHQLQELGG